MDAMDKTELMLSIERRFGKPLEDLILSLYNGLGSTAKVAAALNINTVTLWQWNKRLGINIKTQRTAERVA